MTKTASGCHIHGYTECIQCGKTYPMLSTTQKYCSIKCGKKWYYHNVEKHSKRVRDQNLKKYGITYDDYIRMYTEQDGVCAICGKPETKVQSGILYQLAVDHDHATGKVRGLLCSNCNRGIGHLQDSIEILNKAVRYLNEYKK